VNEYVGNQRIYGTCKRSNIAQIFDDLSRVKI
jgi:hypothetical protein